MASIKSSPNYITGTVGANASNIITADVSAPLAPAEYIGSETDSLRINVDNQTKIISGEVLWTDILGETPNRAYPGNKGAENRSLIENIALRLTDEINRALEADKSLQLQVNRAALNKEALEALIKSAIEEETARAMKAEEDLRSQEASDVKQLNSTANSLRSDLDLEIQNREKADIQIQSNISILNNDLTNKTSRLETQIATEAATARAAEADNKKLIENETKRAQQAENSLSQQLSNSNVVLDSRISALSTQLKNEANRSTQSDTNFSIALNTEITRASARENELDTKINNAITSIDELRQTDTQQLQESISKTKKDLDTLDERVKADIDNLSDRADAIESSLNTHTANIQTNKDSIESTDANVQEIQNTISGVQGDIEALQKQQTLFITETELTNAVNGLNSDIISAENNIRKLATSFENSEKQQASIIADVNTIKEIVEPIPSRLKTIQSTVDTNVIQIKTINESITRLTSSNETIQSNYNDVSKDIAELQTSLTNTTNKLECEEEARLSKDKAIETTIVNINSVMYGVQNDMASATRRIDHQDNRMDILESQLNMSHIEFIDGGTAETILNSQRKG